jgi:hypothetical protein
MSEADFYRGKCEGKKEFAFKMMGMGKITGDELRHYYEMYDHELEQILQLNMLNASQTSPPQ